MGKYIRINLEDLNKRISDYTAIIAKLSIDDFDNINLLSSKISLIKLIISLDTESDLIEKNSVLTKLNQMENDKFDGWSEEAYGGYMTATTTLRNYIINDREEETN